MANRKRTWLWVLLIVIVVLVVARLALPSVLQWYVNKTIDATEGYSGEVGDIDVALIRGAYTIDDIEINKAQGEAFAPLFRADSVDFSILMPAILRGELVGQLAMHQPQVNIVDESPEDGGPQEDEDSADQTGAGADWQKVVLELFPVRFDRIEIHQGEIHFRSPGSEPPVDIYLSQLDATINNLTNSRDLSDSLVATLEANGQIMDSGRLELNLKLDPYRDTPHFDLDGRVLHVDIQQLDPFIRAYTPVDVEAGTMDLVVEMASREGELSGYIKPLLRNIEVFQWREDVEKQDDNVFQVVWEGLADGIGELLQNQPRDQIATRIPVEGTVSGPQPEVITTVFNILRNAFINAFEARLEGQVEWSDGTQEDTESEELGD